MSIGSALNGIERAIARARTWRSHRYPGPLGDFFKAGGNELLLSDLNLSANDLVVDAGAYRGEWADEIMCRYGASIVVIEPVPDFADNLARRYGGNSRVTLLKSALSNRHGRSSISIAEDGSSLFRKGGQQDEVEIDLIDVAQLIGREGPEWALLKLNIEGGEFDVLDRLIETGQLARVRSLLVQFHDNIPDCTQRREQIRAMLNKSHDCQFDYAFVWEYWRRR